MAFLEKKNNARSTLAQALNSGDTSIVVSDTTTFPNSPEFVLTIWDKVTHPDPSDDSNSEIIKVTNIVGSIFQVDRGQEGTSASTHSSGQAVELLITAGQIIEITEFISSLLIIEIPSGTINGINRTFTTSVPYTSGTLELKLNGITLTPGASNDFVEINDTTFEFIAGFTNIPKIANSYTDQLLVRYHKK